MKNSRQFRFLLGGRDLEMKTISDILSTYFSKDIIFDIHLRWGANLSCYQQYFDDVHTFVGIELNKDINPPKNYLEIDHHNEFSSNPSALEQIIKLLHTEFNIQIEITRHLELVSANDCGYIPAMIELNATPQEIDNIRRLDREAQGVTANDEKLAEKSIKDNLTIIGGVSLVKSFTDHFSSITDRLYPCEKLLIYTNTELTYYGLGVSLLLKAFDFLIKQNKAYSGGGSNGYFGITGIGISDIGSTDIAINLILTTLNNGK